MRRISFKLQGSMEQITARTWLMFVALFMVLSAIGPPTYHFIHKYLASSVSHTSNEYRIPNPIQQ